MRKLWRKKFVSKFVLLNNLEKKGEMNKGKCWANVDIIIKGLFCLILKWIELAIQIMLKT